MFDNFLKIYKFSRPLEYYANSSITYVPLCQKMCNFNCEVEKIIGTMLLWHLHSLSCPLEFQKHVLLINLFF